ncbi:unnamed protein product [Gongylonema pulchrum]|uniref:Phage portal protein n=1 Tax=Gongylonema pulchrum TaxID=637853 RepID=A0A183F090_9BILA|nr:unnamed protein product [Gongylonema pulchrum]
MLTGRELETIRLACAYSSIIYLQLRDALANIYVRGAVPVKPDRKLTSSGFFLPRMLDEEWLRRRVSKSGIENAATDTSVQSNRTADASPVPDWL